MTYIYTHKEHLIFKPLLKKKPVYICCEQESHNLILKKKDPKSSNMTHCTCNLR